MHNARSLSLSRLIGRDVDSSMEGLMRSSGAKEDVDTAGETLVTISGRIQCLWLVVVRTTNDKV